MAIYYHQFHNKNLLSNYGIGLKHASYSRKAKGKYMKSLKNLSILSLLLIAFNANAQTDKVTTTKIVDEKNFIFVATSATPLNTLEVSRVLNKMTGPPTAGTINLNGDSYDLRITPDSLISYLPFYGRAFNATPYGGNNDESGYKFTSTNFTYETTKGRKKGWNIAMKTKDVKDNVQMNLSVSEGGYATLSIVSMNKQSITYNGYLKEAKKAPTK